MAAPRPAIRRTRRRTLRPLATSTDSPKKWTPLKVGSEGVDWSVTLDYAP